MMDSLYKVTYKNYNPNATMTEFGLEITVYGEDIDTVEARLHETIVDMQINSPNFKKIRIERT